VFSEYHLINVSNVWANQTTERFPGYDVLECSFLGTGIYI